MPINIQGGFHYLDEYHPAHYLLDCAAWLGSCMAFAFFLEYFPELKNCPRFLVAGSHSVFGEPRPPVQCVWGTKAPVQCWPSIHFRQIATLHVARWIAAKLQFEDKKEAIENIRSWPVPKIVFWVNNGQIGVKWRCSHSPPIVPPMSWKCVLRLHFQPIFLFKCQKMIQNEAQGHSWAYRRDGRDGRVFEIRWPAPILKCYFKTAFQLLFFYKKSYNYKFWPAILKKSVEMSTLGHTFELMGGLWEDCGMILGHTFQPSWPTDIIIWMMVSAIWWHMMLDSLQIFSKRQYCIKQGADDLLLVRKMHHSVNSKLLMVTIIMSLSLAI